MPAFILPKNVALFTRHHVFTPVEIHSRYEILLENYCKTIHIEALTMTDMVKKAIIPSVLAYESDLVTLLAGKKSCCVNAPALLEETLIDKLSTLSAAPVSYTHLVPP